MGGEQGDKELDSWICFTALQHIKVARNKTYPLSLFLVQIVSKYLEEKEFGFTLLTRFPSSQV